MFHKEDVAALIVVTRDQIFAGEKGRVIVLQGIYWRKYAVCMQFTTC